jgi:LysM repeat protein
MTSNNRFYTFIIAIIIIVLPLNASAKKLTRAQYIDKYKKLAQEEMKRTGIPASITIAQALLESDNGNSVLARKSNNHFGIKCHKSWKGRTVRHDDDRRRECFRKYDRVYDSYKDHSNFLVSGRRYAFLFSYKSTDYKRWAKGLRKAGYATDPKYAKRLIKIIEDNKLYLLDNGISHTYAKTRPTKNSNARKTKNTRKVNKQEVYDDDNFEIDIYKKHRKGVRNRIKFIVAKKGDTFYSLAKEFKLMQWQLYKYNELPKDYILHEGDLLYIQPKRSKAEHGKNYHVVKPGETMHIISQIYGIKLKKLYKKNNMEAGTEPEPGTKLSLRKNKK